MLESTRHVRPTIDLQSPEQIHSKCMTHPPEFTEYADHQSESNGNRKSGIVKSTG